MRRGQQAHRIGVIPFDGGKQFARCLPLLGRHESFAFAFDFRQHFRVQPVGFFLRPVLRLRRPGIQQAEERHFLTLLTQTRGDALR
ncbi:hypothetical protein D3C85_1587690 [compost metagenome]